MTPAEGRPTLFLIAGPNGAGKTTFYETALKPRIAAPFVNADIIQRDELGDRSEKAAYKAAKIAAERRARLLEAQESFVTETVFSHPSKLEMLQEAKRRGYRIVVFHLHVSSPELATARVKERVKEGGHPVPERKIEERYFRNQKIIRTAIKMADQGVVYDASALNTSPRAIMRVRAGKADRVVADPPGWFRGLYIDGD